MASPSKRPYFAAFSASLGGFCLGTSLGFSSPSGPVLLSGTDGTIHLTTGQYGVFSSCMNLGALVGAIASGLFMRSFGRRSTMMLSVVPYLVGWCLIIGAQNFGMLVAGRILTGFSSGISLSVIPTYIAEISPPQIRGKLGGSLQLMVSIGLLFTYSLASFLDSFRHMAAACLVPPICHGVFMFFCKKSPMFLISKDREDDAKEALQYFRGGSSEDVSKEFNELVKFVKERAKYKKKPLDVLKSSSRSWRMMLTVLFFFHFNGINPVIFNVNQILEGVESIIPKEFSPIIVGLIQPTFSLVAAVMVDKWGRKLLLMISGGSMGLSLVALGSYFYVKDSTPEGGDYIGWLPLVSVGAFFAAFAIGFGTVPWILLGEIFPPEIRETAAGVSIMLSFLFSYVTTAIYIPLQGLIYIYGVFWMHGGFCFLSVIYCFFFLVETKGKTHQEIAQLFAS